jgi:hypothetical protein
MMLDKWVVSWKSEKCGLGQMDVIVRAKDRHGHGLTGCPSTIIRKVGCGSDFSRMSNGPD